MCASPEAETVATMPALPGTRMLVFTPVPNCGAGTGQTGDKEDWPPPECETAARGSHAGEENVTLRGAARTIPTS